jgi:hypothetical protein
VNPLITRSVTAILKTFARDALKPIAIPIDNPSPRNLPQTLILPAASRALDTTSPIERPIANGTARRLQTRFLFRHSATIADGKLDWRRKLHRVRKHCGAYPVFVIDATRPHAPIRSLGAAGMTIARFL